MDAFLLLSLEELDISGVVKVSWVHGAGAPGKPLAAALEELEILCVVKVPRVHGAGVPGEPPAAAGQELME